MDEEVVTLDLDEDFSPKSESSTKTIVYKKNRNLSLPTMKTASIDLPPPTTPELEPRDVSQVENAANVVGSAIMQNGDHCSSVASEDDNLLGSPSALKITLKKRKKKTEVWTYKKQHRKGRRSFHNSHNYGNATQNGTPPDSLDSGSEKEEEEFELKSTESSSTIRTVDSATISNESTLSADEVADLQPDVVPELGSKVTGGATEMNVSCKRKSSVDKQQPEDAILLASKKVKVQGSEVEVEEISVIEGPLKAAENLATKPTKNGTLGKKEDDTDVKVMKVCSALETELLKDKENQAGIQKAAALVRKMTRKDLEELFLKKMVEFITERSDSALVLRRAEATEKEIVAVKSRLQQMQAQVANLHTAILRNLSDVDQNKEKQPILPVRITRAVGLQVNLGPDLYRRVSRPKAQPNTPNTSPAKNRASGSPASATNASQPSKQAIQRSPSFSPIASRPSPKAVASPRITTQQPPQQVQQKAVTVQPAFTHPAFAQVPPRTFVATTANFVARPPVKQLYASMLTTKPGATKTNTVTSIAPKLPRPATTLSVGNASLGFEKSIMANIHAQLAVQQIRTFPQSGGASSVTTVHKVTLPSPGGSPSRPKVIDLTGEESRQVGYPAIAPALPKPSSILATSMVYVPNSHTGPKRPMVSIPVPTSSLVSTVNASLLVKRTTSSTMTTNVTSAASSLPSAVFNVIPRHPAPLPPPASYAPHLAGKNPPCKPVLKISKVATGQGLVLSWTMQLTDKHADIQTYQLYAYQEGSNPPSTTLWKKVGDVKAMPLPMACTLTQFMEGHRYHFAVRAVDELGREGPYSDPSSILLNQAK